MAMPTSFFVFFITLLFFVSMVQPYQNAFDANGIVGDDLHHKIDCGKECSRRCKLASRQKICHRACGTCCSRCKCVPPGTSGNKDACPCYASMTTHHGRKKCP